MAFHQASRMADVHSEVWQGYGLLVAVLIGELPANRHKRTAVSGEQSVLLLNCVGSG